MNKALMLLIILAGCATEPEDDGGTITVTFPCDSCPAPPDTTITATKGER